MKKIFLLFVAAFLSTALFSENVDHNKALRIAKAFAAQRDRNAAQLKTDIVYSHPMPNKRDAAFYVVNLGETGFVIVSANDVAHPVIGYSFDRPWPTEGNLPSQVAGYLDDLANQIEYATEQTPDRGIKSEWQELLSINPNNPPQPKGNRTEVGPLLTTTWDQGMYYNAMCPEDEYGIDGHAVTGCVATAMAQVVRYWEYPAHGRGQHSYQTFQNEYGTLAVNFEESYYDYDNMPDELTPESSPEEVNAVAKLIYDCGIANVLYYGVDGSTGYPGSPRTAFINHFGYSSNLGFADKHMYTPQEWIALLKSEINDLAPVYCEGHDEIVGHAFVFDGCNTDDFFHVNFGWSGGCDGWFLVSAINVQGYTWGDWQTVLIGVRPGNNNNTLLCQTGSNPSSMNQESYTITEPMMLYNLSAKNECLMNYWDSGDPIILHLKPSDNSSQLVLDVLRFDENCSVAVYDGYDKDSLICVYETRYSNTPLAYDFLPSDTLLQQKATTDLSPVVSTKHGLTVVAYSYGLIDKEFHLRVSDASDCRMVSNIVATPNETGYDLTWNENGSATQWQVAWDDNMVSCETTSLSIDELSHDAIHEVKIRSICGGESYSEWKSIIINKKKYWSDYVEEEPEGYTIVDDKLFISSAEGLAWLYRKCENQDFSVVDNSRTVIIETDIDLSAHIWKPIRYYGKIIGNGHTISNLHTDFYSGDCGLFSQYEGDTISDLHLINTFINGGGSLGSLAGYVYNAVIINCSSTNYVVNNRYSSLGGLLGGAYYSKIINCYSIGENYSGQLNGGLLGLNYHSEMVNCYSSQGSSFNWSSCFETTNGLITGQVNGGIYKNCFANLENIILHWNPEYDSIAKLNNFCGYVNSFEMIQNMAAFRVQGDTIGMIIQDTAINYSLGNIDILTALNNKVIENNTSDLRTWVWDNNLHLPVLGNYYEPICPGIKDLMARNIEINNGFAVALSWTEQGDAEEWQVKCLAENDNAVIHSAFSTNDTVTGLTLGKDYTFFVRPICGGEDTVGWGQPIKLFVDKLYWKDMITECPEGYIEDIEGNVIISSAEGLAWFGKQGQSFEGKTIYIANDIDMGAYRWMPIGYLLGTLDGQNHTISNIICRESTSDKDAYDIGFVGTSQNTVIRNLTIKDGVFSGRMFVGSLFGKALGGYFDNCHIVNTNVIGSNCVGGIGGQIAGIGRNCVVINCSVSGSIYADQMTGGLIGENSADGIISNCYSNCNINSMGKMPLRNRGGLVAGHGGYIYNCYSAGNILFDEMEYYNSTGTCMGGVGAVGTIAEAQFVYARQLNGLCLLGKSDAWLTLPYLVSDTASFNNSGVLNNAVTIGEASYTDLLSALNAWVDANNTSDEYLYWVADTENQNGGFPMLERLPAQEYQIQPLVQGWNWYSTYIEQDGTEGMLQLKSTLGGNGVQIKSQTSTTQHLPNGSWFGTLTTLENEKSYRVNVSAPTTAVLQGTPVNPEEHPITLQPNWTWIGYPVATTQSIAAATTGFTPRSGDMIKSQGSSSIYTGAVWFPSLNLEPGQGYLYKSTAAENRTLTFVQSRGEDPEEATYQKYWTNDIHAFADNMTMVATVTENGEELYSSNYELGAFVNGENRGSVRVEYCEPLDRYVAVLTISGEDGDRITFGLINRATETENFNCGRTVTFTTNAVLGGPENLERIEFKSEDKIVTMTLFPNPVDKNTEFTIDIPTNEKVSEVIITNAPGETVMRGACKSNVIRGISQSGVYNIQIITEKGNNYHGRIIVK